MFSKTTNKKFHHTESDRKLLPGVHFSAYKITATAQCPQTRSLFKHRGLRGLKTLLMFENTCFSSLPDVFFVELWDASSYQLIVLVLKCLVK